MCIVEAIAVSTIGERLVRLPLSAAESGELLGGEVSARIDPNPSPLAPLPKRGEVGEKPAFAVRTRHFDRSTGIRTNRVVLPLNPWSHLLIASCPNLPP